MNFIFPENLYAEVRIENFFNTYYYLKNDNVEENGVGSFRMVFINMSAVAGFSYVFECTGWRG